MKTNVMARLLIENPGVVKKTFATAVGLKTIPPPPKKILFSPSSGMF
jgi:hypothetical protein